MEQIIITRADNSTWPLLTKSAVTSVTQAEQKITLMGEDIVTMTVESAVPLVFNIRDRITVFGSTYILNALPKLLKAGKRKFTYELTWEGRQYDLLKSYYLDEGVDGVSISPDFSLTGNLEFFLNVLINNTNRIFGAGAWVLGVCPVTDYRNLTFSNEKCLAVLQRLCKEDTFNKEFEIIENAGVCTINIKDAIGANHPVTYEYGKGKGLFNLTRETVSEKDVVTRLYVFGANKNLPSNYRGYSQRLKLPGIDMSYIEDQDDIDTYGLIEGVKVFDEIFPHRTGVINFPGATVYEFIDYSMDFDLNALDAFGSTMYLIPEVTAKIHFNTGNLAGYEFGIASYDHIYKKFTLSPFTDERGQSFPDPALAVFQIAAGDKYVLIDILMPQSYVDDAEAELLAAGQAWYDLVSQLRVQYSQAFDELYFKQKYAGQSTVNVFGIGDNVPIKDSDIDVDKSIRLKSFKRDVIRPYQYALDLYDYSEEVLSTQLISAQNETAKINSGLTGTKSTGSAVISGSDFLAKMLTVDGAGSGLDADLFDGLDSTAFSLINHIHDSRYYTEAEIDSFTVKLTGDQSISGNKTFNNNIYGDAVISKAAFTSGFAGTGYKLSSVAGKTLLEVDNLTVREKLSAYELEIREINSVNGGLMISVANGVPYSVVGTRFYFDTDGGANPIQFAVNDYVRAQQWTGTGTGDYVGLVTNVIQSAVLGSAYIDCTMVSGAPWSKMKLVQVGNSTITARQNLIYITASDTDNPYIDLLAGVNAGSFAGKQIIRIGNLYGITDAAFGGPLNGPGLYATNVFLKGKIVITQGSSGYGNMTDKPTTLAGINATEGGKLGGIAAGATVGATWGVNMTPPSRFADAPAGAGLVMTASYMGYYDGSVWKSYIDNAGNSKFVGVTEIGTKWQDGTLGLMSISIKGNNIYEGHFNDHGGHLDINMFGQNGSTTYSRDLRVGDGRGYFLFSTNGFLRTVDFNVPITSNSTIIATGASFSTLAVTGAFGANGAAPQGKYTTTAFPSISSGSFGFGSDSQFLNAMYVIQDIRNALLNVGIIKN